MDSLQAGNRCSRASKSTLILDQLSLIVACWCSTRHRPAGILDEVVMLETIAPLYGGGC